MPSIEHLLEKLYELEGQIEYELASKRAEFQYHFERKRIVFEEEVARRHRELKTSLLNYIKSARPLVVLTAPFIYSVIIPFVMLDVFVSLYQAVCFPVYGITKVRRRDYILFDRIQLPYLNVLEKLNCFYCAYGNGLIGYVREIAARTEQYWCPIKHARGIQGTHQHYLGFLEFGDAEGYNNELPVMREKLAKNTAISVTKSKSS